MFEFFKKNKAEENEKILEAIGEVRKLVKWQSRDVEDLKTLIKQKRKTKAFEKLLGEVKLKEFCIEDCGSPHTCIHGSRSECFDLQHTINNDPIAAHLAFAIKGVVDISVLSLEEIRKLNKIIKLHQDLIEEMYE